MTLKKKLITYQQALSIWHKQCFNQDIQAKIHWQGQGNYQTAFCYLHKQGKCVAQGVGKGLDQKQVELSARYEALENYFSAYYLYQRPIQLASVQNIKVHYHTVPFRFQESFLKQYALPLAVVDCSYGSQPLLNDTYDYSPHHFYASTNGLAIATNYEEALIHAISEIVERDAISYFLLDTYLLKEPLKKVEYRSIPPYLQQLITQLETVYQGKIHLIALPSNYNLPVYCAIFTQKYQDHHLISKGFGASINASYAAERAILEALQTFHVYQHLPEQRIDLLTTPLRDFPVLYDCLQFDLPKLIREHNYQPVEFTETADSDCNLPVKHYLQLLIDKIYCLNSLILVDKIVVSEDGFSCVNVIIPGAEEFFHVFNDQIVIPHSHTKTYIKNKLNRLAK